MVSSNQISNDSRHKKFPTTMVSSSSNCEIPNDALFQIFLHLPIKSLLRFTSVCKYWRALIKGADFVKLYLNQSMATPSHNHKLILWKSSLYITEFASLDSTTSATTSTTTKLDFLPFLDQRSYRMTSCNGLLCIYGDKNLSSIILCNPSTLHYQKLHLSPSSKQVPVSCLGFGYDPLNDDYKVVRILKLPNSSCKGMLCSLKSPSWRRIRDLDHYLPRNYSFIRSHKNTCVNGYLHWIVFNKKIRKRKILSLNLGTEKYGELPIPNPSQQQQQQPRYNLEVQLGVLGGNCLYYATNTSYDHYPVKYTLWVMKDYSCSWTKLCVINKPGMYTSTISSIAHLEREDSKVLFARTVSSISTPFFWYNLACNTVQEINNIHDGVPKANVGVLSNACTCIETIVPLKMPPVKSRLACKRKIISEIKEITPSPRQKIE